MKNISKNQNRFLRLGLFFVLALSGLIFPSLTEVRAQINGESEGPEGEDIIDELKLFSKAIGVILEAYPEDLERRQLLYDAVKGMLDSLDKYSEFIEPDRYELLQIHMKGEYAGIGIILEVIDDFPAAKAVQPGSAAEKAGLIPGDKIIKINGQSTQGWPLSEVSKELRGEEGSSMILTVQRDAVRKIFDIEIIREKIEIESVKDARLIGKAIGYLRVESWQDNTIEQIDRALKSLRGKGMKALIIDLRNNDGGLLPKAVELSERFLEQGLKVVSVDSKIEEQKKEYFTQETPILKREPVVILVNEVSASASEIFSAAMQDHGRATVIGGKTYGKASVQSVIPLDDNSAMKLTTARYLSPQGRDINDVGIEPDITVVNESDGGPQADRQLLKAIELLKQYH